jgi:hypothetical protein
MVKHIRDIAIILMILVSTSCSNQSGDSTRTSNQRFDNGSAWYLIAQSNVILKTEVDIPVKIVDTMYYRDNFGYITLKLSCKDCYKGKVRSDSVSVKLYVGNFKKEVLDSLNKKSCLFFLSDISGGIGLNDLHVNYFSQATRDKENLVINECKTQTRILKDFTRYSDEITFYGENTVKSLVENIVNPSEGYSIRDTLDKLDSTYCPALIKYMNDYRKIKVNYIILKNDPGFCESFRRYGPDEVIDYLAAILNDITNFEFGSIYNGDYNDMVRQDSYHGWVIWLYNKYNLKSIRELKH